MNLSPMSLGPSFCNTKAFKVKGMFSSTHIPTSTQVVIKCVPPTNPEKKLLKEAKHPHIIQLAPASLKSPFIVLPQFPDGDLCDWMIDEKKFSWTNVVQFTQQISSALTYVHKKLHHVHADVSLENVLVHSTEEGKLIFILMDFGLAYPTNQRFLCGKRAYAAPELHDCEGWINGIYDVTKVDVFALGICLFSLVFNLSPFEDSTHCKRFGFFARHGLQSMVDYFKCASARNNQQNILTLIEKMIWPWSHDRISMQDVFLKSHQFVF
jgi:serine/threonine protein kinase